MADYVLNRSDPANGTILVLEDQINGPSLPWSPAPYVSPSHTAYDWDSPLVFAGQGVTNYGELIQNNFVYLTENFAYKSRPILPMQGQIWYKNANYTDPSFPLDPTTAGLYLYTGTEWAPILAGDLLTNLNFGGAVLTNIGNPVNPTDALNLQTGDARYVEAAGDTVTGMLTFTSGGVDFSGGTASFQAGVVVTVADAPSANTHVANKLYVDTREAVVTGLVSAEAVTRQNADTALSNSISIINGQLPDFVNASGDTVTGNITFDLNASLVMVAGGTGVVDVGGRKIEQVGTPTNNADATTKLYVDTAIAGVSGSGSADGVVASGSLNSSTGTLTLVRTMGLPNVTITGFAPFTHTHVTTAVTHQLGAVYSASYLAQNNVAVSGYPNLSLRNSLISLDQAATQSTRRVHRHVVVANGIDVTFNMGSNYTYRVGENKLQVFSQGIKQYASERGKSTIIFAATNLGLLTTVGIATATYTFDITVNGGAPTTITVPVAPSTTYLDMITTIRSQLTFYGVPAILSVDQRVNRIDLIFQSNAVGNPSSIVISNGTGDLFDVIPAASDPVDVSITTDYAYEEVGNPDTMSSSITFNVPPANGTVLEMLVFP